MKTNKLFFLTTMTSELSKYLKEQLSVFSNVKQKKIKLAKNIKNGFLSKIFSYNVILYQIKILMLYMFWKSSYVPL